MRKSRCQKLSILFIIENSDLKMNLNFPYIWKRKGTYIRVTEIK